MIRINLAPVETRKRRPSFALPVPSFNLGVLFAILYILGAAGVGYTWWDLSSDKAKMAADFDRGAKELESLKATLGQGASVKTQLADMKRRVEVIEELTRGQGRPILMLDAFADVVPPDLWITGMEHKDSVLKLTGTAFSTTAVSDFMTKLKGSGKFKDVDIVISRQALDKTPSLVTFEVTCKFEG